MRGHFGWGPIPIIDYESSLTYPCRPYQVGCAPTSEKTPGDIDSTFHTPGDPLPSCEVGRTNGHRPLGTAGKNHLAVHVARRPTPAPPAALPAAHFSGCYSTSSKVTGTRTLWRIIRTKSANDKIAKCTCGNAHSTPSYFGAVEISRDLAAANLTSQPPGNYCTCRKKNTTKRSNPAPDDPCQSRPAVDDIAGAGQVEIEVVGVVILLFRHHLTGTFRS